VAASIEVNDVRSAQSVVKNDDQALTWARGDSAGANRAAKKAEHGFIDRRESTDLCGGITGGAGAPFAVMAALAALWRRTRDMLGALGLSNSEIEAAQTIEARKQKKNKQPRTRWR
jgi:hypothetical protein